MHCRLINNKYTYRSIFCAKKPAVTQNKKRAVIIIHDRDSLSEVEGAEGVSEKGSVVCKTVMASFTLDIHQSTKSWQ